MEGGTKAFLRFAASGSKRSFMPDIVLTVCFAMLKLL
jgi:hypothetical protein